MWNTLNDWMSMTQGVQYVEEEVAQTVAEGIFAKIPIAYDNIMSLPVVFLRFGISGLLLCFPIILFGIPGRCIGGSMDLLPSAGIQIQVQLQDIHARFTEETEGTALGVFLN